MERRQILLPVGALILAVLLVSGIAVAQDGEPQGPAVPAEALRSGASATNFQFALSTSFTYQGQLEYSGEPVNDACEMAFRLYDQAGGGSELGVVTHTVPITEGLFTVSLDFGAGAFDGDRRWLGIAVDCDGVGGYADLGRQELTAAPYAQYAMGAPWDGLVGVPVGFADGVDDDTTYTPGEGLVLDGTEFSAQGSPYANMVVVAKSGGNYASVQAAIDSITDAAEDNAYLVWVAPGVYSETVTMKPYVHLQGAGQEATVITSTVCSSSLPPSQATLVLTRSTSLRDLTVGNGSTEYWNVALVATAGTTETLVTDVTAWAEGEGTYNSAVFLSGSGTGVTLQHVTALAENGSGSNYGLFNVSGAEAVLRGGSFTGHGGGWAVGINNNGSGTTLEATDVTALGENGSSHTYGLVNGASAGATLRGGSFTGRGGIETYGVSNAYTATLAAEGVIALGEEGSSDSYGLHNADGAEAVLRGGSFTARGGGDTYGISNAYTTTLEATDVTALGEEGSSDNYGLVNRSGAEAVLRGGSFTARGGTYARGIYNYSSGATLAATGVTALGENGGTNYGLSNRYGVAVLLCGGSFTARGGSSAAGIYSYSSGTTTTLEATGVTALGENGSGSNYGLHNVSSAAAALRGGSFTARGGNVTFGIHNHSSGTTTTLKATGVTALGENGGTNYGLRNGAGTAVVDSSRLIGSIYGLGLDAGTVYLGVTQLDGGAYNSGTLTCFQVYDENYASHSCNP